MTFLDRLLLLLLLEIVLLEGNVVDGVGLKRAEWADAVEDVVWSAACSSKEEISSSNYKTKKKEKRVNICTICISFAFLTADNDCSRYFANDELIVDF
jgi:hypothetical protein